MNKSITTITALVMLFFATTLPAAQFRTDNFLVTAASATFAKECATVAERFRRDLALEWVGKEMPQWTNFCPIRVKVTNSGSGGRTTYGMRGGHVVAWDMQVQGTKKRILDSMLPHEITHTIFISVIRWSSIPRWADEGAALYSEHPDELAKYVTRSKEMALRGQHIPFREMFSMRQYPHDGQKMVDLYSQGYTVARILIEKKGKREFFRFLKTRASAHDLQQRYGLTIPELFMEWKTAMHPPAAEVSPPPPSNTPSLATPILAEAVDFQRPTLYIYGAVYCAPCQQMKQHRREGLLGGIDKKFFLVFRDIGRYQSEAKRLGITNVPAFVINDSVIAQKYSGPEWLLAKLKSYETAPCEMAGAPSILTTGCGCRNPRCRCRAKSGVSESMIRAIVVRFMQDNALLFRGEEGKLGEQGFTGPAPNGQQIRTAVAAWLADNPIDGILEGYVVSYMDEHRYELRGEDGADGIDGVNGADGQDGFDAALPDLSLYLTRDEFNDWKGTTEIPPPVIAPIEERHIVIVADKDSEYWPRLEVEIERAQNFFSGIKVAPPPEEFTVQHPQIVIYEDGTWKKRVIGNRAVNEALNQIARDVFVW